MTLLIHSSTCNRARVSFSPSSSLRVSRNSRVHSRKYSETCALDTFVACWRVHNVVDNRTLRFSSLARGIICRYHFPHMSDESATARLPPAPPRESTFHFAVHRCTCSVHYSLRAIFIHRAIQRPAGIVYERSTAWKHVTKLLASTGRAYSVLFRLFLGIILISLSHFLITFTGNRSRGEITLLTIKLRGYKVIWNIK